jgi:hypothetical protein
MDETSASIGRAALQAVKARQAAWVSTFGPLDALGYAESLEANLCSTLSMATRREFARGSGSELSRKMRAPHSSSALVCNVFDHWRSHDTVPLQKALRLPEDILAITFEAQYHTGLRGTPPNVDVVLTLANGRVAAFESKFLEPYSTRSVAKPLEAVYLPGGCGLWARRGLSACQTLAESLRTESPFSVLDVKQLLKHALGLAREFGNCFSLGYLWYELDTPLGAGHRDEIFRFAERVGSELGFVAMSYQELIRRLGAVVGSGDQAYLEYLSRRYG